MHSMSDTPGTSGIVVLDQVGLVLQGRRKSEMVQVAKVRVCVSCGEELALDRFGKKGDDLHGREDCKGCANAASKRSREKSQGVLGIGNTDVKALVQMQLAVDKELAGIVSGYTKLNDAQKAVFRLAVGIK